MPLRKWSLEDLERELPLATSQRDLARRLGMAGHSTTKSIIRMANEAGMDTRHLVGKRYEQHRRTKVDDETLANLVAECFSVSEVLRKAGYILAGGSHAALSNRIRQLRIDTSHFEQRRSPSPSNRKTPQDILVRMPSDSFRTRTDQLRRALLEVGVPHKCARCGQQPEWMGKPLTLQVEHINGDRLDCRKENLCFLCPNCHTQTETYARRVKVKGT